MPHHDTHEDQAQQAGETVVGRFTDPIDAERAAEAARHDGFSVQMPDSTTVSVQPGPHPQHRSEIEGILAAYGATNIPRTPISGSPAAAASPSQPSRSAAVEAGHIHAEPVLSGSPLERVREGMVVLDERGTRLGTVKRVRMGDPEAVTAVGAVHRDVLVTPANEPTGRTPAGGAVPFLAEPQDEPDVPDPLRLTLRRVGFIEVDSPDLHGMERYIPGDRVGDVTGETVQLGPAGIATTTRPAHWTGLGTPQPEPAADSATPPWLWSAAAGGGALVAAGGLVGVWRVRRQQRRRPQARVRHWVESLAEYVPDDSRARAGGLGAILFAFGLGAALGRAQPRASTSLPVANVPTPAMRFDGAMLSPRLGLSLGLGMGVLGLAIVVLLRRWRSPGTRVEYIGTPGVESAAGRDRVRSGELPPSYASERGRRAEPPA